MPLTPPNGGTLHYRLVGVPPGVSFTLGTADPLSDDLFYVTSKYNANHPWIESPPEGDGQSVDWKTGRVEDGWYSVRVIDVPDTEAAITCGLPVLITDNNSAGLTADYIANGWTVNGGSTGASTIAFGNTVNNPYLQGFILFGSGTYNGYIEKTFNGTEDGGPAWQAGQRVGVSFRISWTLDTGPGNIFAEIEGGTDPETGESVHRVSFPNGSYDFWTIPSELAPNYIHDGFLSGVADSNGELKIRLGGENYGGSCNVYCEFQDLQVVSCTESDVPSETSRYVTRWLADDFARQQMLGWQFYIEQSTDGGTTWPTVLYSGYLTNLTLDESLVYEFEIGDTRKVERNTAAWRNINPIDNTSDAHPTALIGGPIYGGFQPFQDDRGLPTFEVIGQAAATANLNPNLPPDGYVQLEYKSGPLPAEGVSTGPTGRFDDLAFHIIVTALSQGFYSPYETPASSFTGSFPGLRASLFTEAGVLPAALEDLTPLSQGPLTGRIGKFVSSFSMMQDLMNKNGQMVLRWGVTDTVTYPNGTRFKVLMHPREIAEEWPMHWQGHPVDFVTQMHTRHGLDYDSASATSVRAALGDDLAVSLRPRDPNETIQDAFEKLFARFGFAIRMNSTGDREFFLFRQKPDAVPTLEITSDDIYAEGGPTYELGEFDKVNRVVLRSELFRKWDEDSGETRTYDGLVTHDSEQAFDYSSDGGTTTDAENYGALEQVYEMPGHVAWAADYQPMNILQTGDALARTVFEKYGRGVQAATIMVLRGTDGDSITLGTPFLNSIDHSPNAQQDQTPTSQRGGRRTMRALQRTVFPEGYELRVEDEDTGVAYDGTWSLALTDDAIAPLYFRALAVTGSTELLADKAWLEIEVQLAASQPASSTHGFQYTILDGQQMVDDGAVAVDPFTYRLGPFPQGQKAWVRGRAFYVGGGRSSWSTWTGTGGSAPAITGDISAISTGVPVSAGTTLSWTNTNTTHNVKVQLKLDTASAYAVIATLLPTSTSYPIVGLVAGTDYDVRVALVDKVTGAEAGTVLTGSFTTAAAGSMVTLTGPSSLQVFGGHDPVTGLPSPGVFGLQVMAVFGPPHFIVFEQASESAVGSGTAGAYAVVARTPAVVGDWTRYRNTAPDDSKLRYLRAYAEAEGYTDSATSAAFSVDPWPATPTVPDPHGPSVAAGEIFGARNTDLMLLRHEGMRSVLGITAGGASITEDDVEVILAGQIFGA
jgi:hypothetical protein